MLKMNKEEIVGFLNDMLDSLTWTRVGLITLFTCCMFLMLIVFDNRTTVFNKIFSEAPIEKSVIPWEISENSKSELVKLVNSQPLISAALIMEVNLKKNRRAVKFWYAQDSLVREEVNRTILTLLPQSFFNDDKRNNDQMLAVLNNQFQCTPTTETVFVRLFSVLPKSMPYVCRLAVPPFAGSFAGFATLFLTRSPVAADIDSLKIELTRISIEMYLRDIDNRHSN